MRITYCVHQFFPFFYTGTERVTLNLAKQMQRMGHSVQVLSYGTGDNPADYAPLTPRVNWREYSHEGVPVVSLLHTMQPEGFGFAAQNDAIQEASTELLRRYSTDVVHVMHPMRIPSAAQVAREMGIPVTLTLCDFWLLCPRINLFAGRSTCTGPDGVEKCIAEGCVGPGQRGVLARRRIDTRRILDAAQVVVAPSEFVKTVFVSNGLEDDKTLLIRHGTDYAVAHKSGRRSQPGSEITFGFVGTILPIKGLHVLLEAVGSLTETNIRLRIYGEAFHEVEYGNYVRDFAERDPRIEVMGPYEYEDFASLAAELDVVVVPSIVYESSSLVVSLALACGVPVIAPNVGGPPELVRNDVNGYTFTPGDVTGLAAILQRIAIDPSALNALRDAIIEPPRIEEESFAYDRVYRELAL